MPRGPKTNAARLLEAAGIDYELAPYDLHGAAFSAEAVAEALGMPEGRVFKTLAVRSGLDTYLAVVPGGTDLDLKATAKASGTKKVEMLPVAKLRGVTGYERGSVTALATKPSLRVLLDESALAHETIAVSAGREGLQILVAPGDYVAVTGAVVARILP